LNSIALAAFQELFARSSGQGRVFVNMQGEPLKGYKHWFDPALREVGISFFTVAELMGHKTIQMTMRYAHLAPAHKLAVVERLAAEWQTVRPTDTSSFEQESGGVSKAS
jgi:integrase